MLKKDIPIAQFPLGIDQLSDESSLPRGTARDMLNVDVFASGQFGSRSGFTKISSFENAHSLWGSSDGTFGLYVRDGQLRRMIVQGDTPLSAVVLSGIAPNAPMTYFEYAGEVVFTNGIDLGVITAAGVRRLGVDTPPAPDVSALTQGTLPAGRYSVALSYVLASGEESGLSEMVTLDLAVQGGISFDMPQGAVGAGAAYVRVYSTSTNGNVLYQCANVPVGLTSFDLLDLQLGKVADTQFLRRMPAGHIVRVFNGRLVVARGDTLWFSEPFRYGLTSPRHNFVRFNGPITMVEPVVGGVYVSTDTVVYFLAGGGPRQFDQRVASMNACMKGGSTLVPGGRLPGKLADQGGDMAAVWLGHAGYSIGMRDGTVHDIHSTRIALPKTEAKSAVHFQKDGLPQVLSIVESTQPADPGAAVDSSV